VIYRGVITYVNVQTLWGKLVYAPTADGHSVVDALSAALMVNAVKVARGICTRRVGVSYVVLARSTFPAWLGTRTG
jgi:hypothetical protein